MKKVLLVVIMFMMFAGVVSAATINGDYKGKPIVIMKSGGKELTVEDVPAMILDGRTMVPISMLRQIGLGVEWDAEEYAVDVILPTPSEKPIDSEKLKTYVWALDYYGSLRNLSDYFHPVQLTLQLSLASIEDNSDIQGNIESAENIIGIAVDWYNNLQEQETKFVDALKSSGITDQYINSSLNNFYNAIDYYELALVDLIDYSNGDKTIIKINGFFDNLQKAINETNKGVDAVNAGYSFLYTEIQNYQGSATTQPENVIFPTSTNDVIESEIDGDFEGFEYEKIFKLTNGQIWEQTDIKYKYSYKFMPDVTIYKDGTIYYMIVDGVEGKIKVKQIK